jgi:hypothetical protein
METNADLDLLKTRMSDEFAFYFQRAAANTARSKAFREATGTTDITPKYFDQNSLIHIRKLFASQLFYLSIIVAVSPVVNELITRQIILEAMHSIETDTIEWFKSIFNLHTDDTNQIYNAICVVMTGTLSQMCITELLVKVTGNKLDGLRIIYDAIESGNLDVVDRYVGDMRRYFENMNERIGQFFLGFVAIVVRKEVVNLLNLKISDEFSMQFQIVAGYIGNTPAFQQIVGTTDRTPKEFRQDSLVYIRKLFDSQLPHFSMIEFVTPHVVNFKVALREMNSIGRNTIDWVATTFHLPTDDMRKIYDVICLLMKDTLSRMCINALLTNLREENELDRLRIIYQAIDSGNFEMVDQYVAGIRTYFESVDTEIGRLFIDFIRIAVNNRINAILENNLHEQEQEQEQERLQNLFDLSERFHFETSRN